MVGSIHIWTADLDDSTSSKAMIDLLSKEELDRADKFMFDRDRHRFANCRSILRCIIGRYLDMNPRDISFVYGPYGKPALAHTLSGDLQFNLSHSGGLALFAFAGFEIGVDVELVHPFSNLNGVASRLFSKEEYKVIYSLPELEKIKAFYRLWTRKEAAAKAIGSGLYEMDQPGQAWFIRDVDPSPGYIGAIATEHEGFEMRFFRYEKDKSLKAA